MHQARGVSAVCALAARAPEMGLLRREGEAIVDEQTARESLQERRGEVFFYACWMKIFEFWC